VSDDWFWPKVPHGTFQLLDSNRSSVSKFVAQLNWTDAPGDARFDADFGPAGTLKEDSHLLQS